MMTSQRTWQNAITLVLQDAVEPLHYKEISSRIIERGLLTTYGRTPENTVSERLTRGMLPSGLVEKTGPGTYRLSIAHKAPGEETIKEAQQEDEFTRIAAYGLYWDRNKVVWNPGQGGKRQLLGLPSGSTEPIDFANQSGVYVLYNRLTPMYVGRTDKNNLFGRLEDHNSNDRRGSRWDQFSWFGFRRVNQDYKLSDETISITTPTLITVLETVMIEAFIPPLNDKGGDLLGAMYSQVEDPILVNQREVEFRTLVAKAIAPN